jgi:hypothetical protein
MSGPMTSLRIAPMMVASTGKVSISQKTQRYRKISLWENGYIESFNARLRDELLNGEILGWRCARSRHLEDSSSYLYLSCILIVFRSDAVERESH